MFVRRVTIIAMPTDRIRIIEVVAQGFLENMNIDLPSHRFEELEQALPAEQ